jgi:hypothetical protein
MEHNMTALVTTLKQLTAALPSPHDSKAVKKYFDDLDASARRRCLSQICPHCAAPVNEMCKTRTGKPYKRHRSKLSDGRMSEGLKFHHIRYLTPDGIR